MTTTATNDIKFRSKFEKLLNDENREAVTAIFAKFCSLEFYSALDILWRLTYNPDASEALEELGLNAEVEIVFPLRNELRHQYEKIHGEFSGAIIYGAGIKEPYEALKNASDAITAYVVYEHCVKAIYTANVERTLYLLGSSEEKNFFGGIRSMQFNKKEAEFLKSYHLAIHSLFKAMCEEDNLIVKENKVYDENVFEEELDDAVEEAYCEVQKKLMQTEEVSAETPTEEPAKPTSKYKPLTPEEILAHKAEFSAFIESEGDLNLLVKIGQYGFDVNVVYTKLELIKEFLEIAALFAI